MKSVVKCCEELGRWYRTSTAISVQSPVGVINFDMDLPGSEWILLGARGAESAIVLGESESVQERVWGRR